MSNERGNSEKRLSARALLNISQNLPASDFAFVFGSARYECPRLLADFLSPRLCQYHLGGIPQDEFTFETQLMLADFESFISHCYGSFCGLTEAKRGLFVSVARELGNFEICALLVIDCEGPYNSILEYLSGRAWGKDFEFLSAKELSLLAQNFHELPESFLQNCPIELLSELLSHRDLKITDEDSLLTLLSSLWTDTPAYSVLSEFIHFEFLSVHQIQHFFDSSFDFLLANPALWRSIGSRLMLPLRRVVEVPFDSATPLNGIIAYLSKVYRQKGCTSTNGLYGLYLTDAIPQTEIVRLEKVSEN
jgi:hypothetical protein